MPDDTGNFTNAFNAFQQVQLDVLINSPINNTAAEVDQSLVAVESELRRLHDAAEVYFGSVEFRKTIPFDTRNTIDQNLTAYYTSFVQIITERTNNPGNFSTQRQNYITQIRSYLSQMYMVLIIPKELYVLSSSADFVNRLSESTSNANKILEDINSYKSQSEANTTEIGSLLSQSVQEADENKKTLSNLLAIAKESVNDIKQASGSIAINELAKYFYELSLGKYNQQLESDKELASDKDFWHTIYSNLMNKIAILKRSILLAILLIIAVLIINIFIDVSGYQWLFYGAIILAVITITPISYVVVEIYKRYFTGYQGKSRLWLGISILVSLFTFTFSTYLFREIIFGGIRPDAEMVLVKAIVLLPLFYLSRFALTVYKSNIHLSVTNIHRATTLQTAKVYINGLSMSSDARDQISIKIAGLVFDPGETGFISKSLGAGSDNSDNPDIINIVKP